MQLINNSGGKRMFKVTKRASVEDGRKFKLSSVYMPSGDQPEAIDQLTSAILRGESNQVLLGVTGSGKTFTMAHVIQNIQRPTLVFASHFLLHSSQETLRIEEPSQPICLWATSVEPCRELFGAI